MSERTWAGLGRRYAMLSCWYSTF